MLVHRVVPQLVRLGLRDAVERERRDEGRGEYGGGELRDKGPAAGLHAEDCFDSLVF
jgi:hypothetical protein